MSLMKVSSYLSFIACAAFFFSMLTGCQSPQPAVPVSNNTAPTPVVTPITNLRAEDIVQAFKAAGLPISGDIVYSEESDPNNLLGRPNQYTGKASWNDTRIERVSPDDRENTVEVFASTEDLENRRRYVEAIGRSASVFAQYYYVHKNAFLRLSHKITPQQAAEYERVFRGL